MKKYDASIPRWRYWDTEIGSSQTCPKCKSPLEKEYHTYLMLIKEGNEVTPLMTGNDGGRFCPNCPVVVLDHDVFSEGAVATGAAKRAEFMVVGIVDLEAIPEDKRDIPLGDDENPIPLVEFLNTQKGGKEPPKRHSITRKRRRLKQLKRKKKK